MNLFDKFILWLNTSPKVVPTNWSLFHILFLVITAAITILLCVFFRNSSDKTFRKISLIFWIIIVVLEVLKIFCMSIEVNNGVVTYEYNWTFFSYQFCSSPLYVLPFVVFLKDGKVRDCFIAFVSTFCFFAGFAVMLMPDNAFCHQVFINHQTMVHHGTQVILGIYYACYFRKKINVQYFLKAIPVFVVMALIAVLMNETFGKILYEQGYSFNMWYIASYGTSPLILLCDIQPLVSYPIFVTIYFVGFFVVAFLMNIIQFGIIKLVNLLYKK